MKRYVYSVLGDFGLVILYLMIVQPLMSGIAETIQQLSGTLAKNAETVSRDFVQNPSMLEIIRGNPELALVFNKMMMLIFFVVVITYLLYCLMQSISWYNCGRITGKRIEFFSYAKKFTLFTAPFFLVFVLQQFIAFFVRFRQIVSGGSSVGMWVMNIILLFIFYFAMNGYVYLYKDSVRKSLKKAFSFERIIPFIIVIAVLYIVNLIVVQIPNLWLLLLIGSLVMFPLITVSRVLFVDKNLLYGRILRVLK